MTITEQTINSAIDALSKELYAAYTQPEGDQKADPQEIETATTTAQFVKDLINKYLTPVLHSNMKASAAVAAAKTSAVAGATTDAKKKSSWTIFLSENAKLLPGWKEATNKMSFASTEYKKLTDAAKEQLVTDYYSKHGAPVPTAGTGAKRVSGLDAFKIDWYQRRKQTDPTAKGIDARCTDEWKSLTDVQKNDWKEIRREQVAGKA
jgi:hypothetical protein